MVTAADKGQCIYSVPSSNFLRVLTTLWELARLVASDCHAPEVVIGKRTCMIFEALMKVLNVQGFVSGW